MRGSVLVLLAALGPASCSAVGPACLWANGACRFEFDGRTLANSDPTPASTLVVGVPTRQLWLRVWRCTRVDGVCDDADLHGTGHCVGGSDIDDCESERRVLQSHFAGSCSVPSTEYECRAASNCVMEGPYCHCSVPSWCPDSTSSRTTCRYTNDGECDETTGICPIGTDTNDCRGQRPPPPPYSHPPPPYSSSSRRRSSSSSYSPPPPPAQSHHSMAYVITFGLIIFCLRMLAWLACKKATGQAVGQVTQGQSRTRPSTRVQPALAPPGNRNENTPAILMRSRSGNRAAILVPTRRQREPGLLSAPIVNPVGVQPADYIPPELMLSDGPAGAAVVPSESAIQATTLSSIRNTVLESTCPLVIFCSGTHAFVLCIVSR